MSAWIDDLLAWWATVPPEWVFLYALPFLVAAVALLALRWEEG
jgi:hypothetical protein